MPLRNQFGALNLESTQQERFGGNKEAVTATTSVSGDTVLFTPATGKRVKLYWIYAITDTQSSNSPIVSIRIGSRELYRFIGAIAHWEPFIGAPNEQLIIGLNTGGTNVVVTAHYTEED